eukprot:975368-Prorocentrum_minimum.AAC.1
MGSPTIYAGMTRQTAIRQFWKLRSSILETTSAARPVDSRPLWKLRAPDRRQLPHRCRSAPGLTRCRLTRDKHRRIVGSGANRGLWAHLSPPTTRALSCTTGCSRAAENP